MSSPARGPLPDPAAVALVVGSSAAVLVVEIVALRLLAPYLGLTLETSTLVIGLALTAIALGSWAGGRLADTVPPRRLLPPLLAVSGVVVAATPFVVRAAGTSPGTGLVLLAASASLVLPAALLSAVTPLVTALQLTTLDRTGSVVGRLSGLSTAGAILGTVVTGFVLISRVPVSGILVGLGAALAVVGVVLAVLLRGGRPPVAALLLVGLGGVGAAAAPGGCDVETGYHCAQVVADPDGPPGSQVLVLDGLRHSYVVPDDPLHLDFGYTQAIASYLDVFRPEGEPVDGYHLGAGGLTVPRYLDATRPGSTARVSEIDRGVVAVDETLLGTDLTPTGDLAVRVEDGRLGLRRLAPASYDVVVGDAFGGVSVPWHLTTREAVADVRRALRPDGVYVMNIIDNGPLDLARAELATLRAEMAHVAVASLPDTLALQRGGNLVALASDAPLDLEAWAARMQERMGEEPPGDTPPYAVLSGEALDVWIGDAPLLTDDHAPVDQLLTPYRTR